MENSIFVAIAFKVNVTQSRWSLCDIYENIYIWSALKLHFCKTVILSFDWWKIFLTLISYCLFGLVVKGFWSRRLASTLAVCLSDLHESYYAWLACGYLYILASRCNIVPLGEVYIHIYLFLSTFRGSNTIYFMLFYSILI